MTKSTFVCAGANGYLLKNTPPAKLLEGIREVVDGGAPMSPEIARRVVELFRRFRPPGPAAHNLTPHEGVSKHTIGYHGRNIYGKLEVHSKTEAVATALRHGFLN